MEFHILLHPDKKNFMIRKFIPALLILLIPFISVAQRNHAGIIRKDTINLRGIITDEGGKPLPHVDISSRSFDLEYNEFLKGAYTDSAGYFEIKGALFKDTLTITYMPFNFSLKIENQGSRFLRISLPFKYHENKPVELSAKRIHPKTIPSFKIKKDEAIRDIFCGTIEVFPEFPGGADNFQKFIYSHLHYPEKALNNNIEGTVKIAFTVNPAGGLGDFKILQGIGYGCEEEVIRILKICKWKPGISSGRPIYGAETVSVKFTLTD